MKGIKQSFKFSCDDEGLILFDRSLIKTEEGQWSLLHEIGHAMLGHRVAVTKEENLANEKAAWEWAAARVNQNRFWEFANECLGTYERALASERQCISCGSTNTVEWSVGQWTCRDCYCDW